MQKFQTQDAHENRKASRMTLTIDSYSETLQIWMKNEDFVNSDFEWENKRKFHTHTQCQCMSN